jgi:hypothetical protein
MRRGKTQSLDPEAIPWKQIHFVRDKASPRRPVFG